MPPPCTIRVKQMYFSIKNYPIEILQQIHLYNMASTIIQIGLVTNSSQMIEKEFIIISTIWNKKNDKFWMFLSEYDSIKLSNSN